jgi:hypothetical protein
MEVSIGIWAVFCAVIVALLLVDLLVAGRTKGVPPFRQSIAWSIFWTILAIAFTGVPARSSCARRSSSPARRCWTPSTG